MRRTWRWFGPQDRVSISDMRQAGVQGVVTALHHIPNGTVWPVAEIEARQALIAEHPRDPGSGLRWEVVESLPVSEDIKRQTGDWRAHIDAYKQSIRHLAQCGIHTICYNFMPVLDWTRTDLGYKLDNGARCMRFDIVDFAAFDIHILGRHDAGAAYPEDLRDAAATRFEQMSEARKTELMNNVVCGLPGAEEGYSLEDLRGQLALYDHVPAETLRQHQIDFLEAVVPVAEDVGARLCCHPDDPPFPLLGLPRVMSTEDDYRRLVTAVESPANGITLCSGSLGVRADNDLPGIMDRLGDKVHFLHLRNVAREGCRLPHSFHEAAHLEGATDMVALVAAILRQERKRRLAGRADCDIPFRPDHGQDILSDLAERCQPGYPAVGRLKGLAELRGIIEALAHPDRRTFEVQD